MSIISRIYLVCFFTVSFSSYAIEQRMCPAGQIPSGPDAPDRPEGLPGIGHDCVCPYGKVIDVVDDNWRGGECYRSVEVPPPRQFVVPCFADCVTKTAQLKITDGSPAYCKGDQRPTSSYYSGCPDERPDGQSGTRNENIGSPFVGGWETLGECQTAVAAAGGSAAFCASILGSPEAACMRAIGDSVQYVDFVPGNCTCCIKRPVGAPISIGVDLQ